MAIHRKLRTPADLTSLCLIVVAVLAAAGGVVKFFEPGQEAKVALYYLLTGGALLVLREVKSLSFGDWKLELQQRLEEMKEQIQQDSPLNGMTSPGGGTPSSPGNPRGASFRAPQEPSRAGATASESEETDSTLTGNTGDPRKGQFGSQPERNGRILEAILKPAGDGSNDVYIQLIVRSLDERARPLTGVVDFYLHPTFPYSERRIAVRDGQAVLNLRAYGAFTVGAVADGGVTPLELNLASTKGGTKSFYEL